MSLPSQFQTATYNCARTSEKNFWKPAKSNVSILDEPLRKDFSSAFFTNVEKYASDYFSIGSNSNRFVAAMEAFRIIGKVLKSVTSNDIIQRIKTIQSVLAGLDRDPFDKTVFNRFLSVFV